MFRLALVCSPKSSAWQRSVVSASLVAASALFHNHYSASVRSITSSEPAKKNNNDNNKKDDNVFDVTREWEQATAQGREYFKKWIVTDDNNTVKKETQENKDEVPSSPANKLSDFVQDLLASNKPDDKNDKSKGEGQDEQMSLTSILKNVSSILLPGGDDDKKALADLVEQARKTSSGDVKDSTSFTEIITIMEEHFSHIDDTMQQQFGHIDLQKLFPSSMYYYIEREDEVKNPSWKRLMHRFHPGVDISQVKDLMSALYLAELSYASSLEEIQQGLQHTRYPVELVYCDTESIPNKPAHFILLKQNQSFFSDSLQVVMVVRGTRSISDAMTDCFIHPTTYRGGKAHEGILESGRYLVGQHSELLQKLCQYAGKKQIQLTLIGHSMGAGAAAIAGMEWNDHPQIDVQVIGFGCPSLLSEELSEKVSSFITTVICDADMIPRMNGATIGNKLLDIMEYDWIPKARRDVVLALNELQRFAPSIITESSTISIMDTVDSWLDIYVKPTICQPTTQRAPVVLYPPGECIHFWRDGSGITASVVSGKFFNELDVTRRMVDDHLIDAGYRRIFLEVMRQYHRNHHFTFEEDEYWK